MRRGAKPGKAKVEGKRPVAKLPTNEGSSDRQLEKRLEEALKREAEALEQQTATSEVLRVISRSPSDIQPVLDAVAESAARLCKAFDAAVFRLDGDRLLLAAHHGPVPVALTLPLVRGTVNGRAVLDRRPVHVADIQTEADEFPESSALTRVEGVRTLLSVPLMRDGAAIGTINLRRTEPRLFTERQIALLQTFADQAVIAIENVRLFKELETRNTALTEALDRQTATSEVLQAISASLTDVQPVFETILANAVRLCDAKLGQLCLRDGEDLRWVASHGATAATDALVRGTVFKAPPSALRPHGPWRPLQIPDLRETEPYRLGWSSWREQVDVEDARTVVAVPLVKGSRYLGSIFVYRREVRPFTDKQVELLRTFADQAVIAIENVRLFNETKEALEQQTATGEILGVISSSPTDVQPVFDAVAGSAMRLCQAEQAVVVTFDGEVMHLAALSHFDPRGVEAMRQTFPVRADRASALGRAVVSKTVAHIPSLMDDPEYGQRGLAQVTGFRGGVAVPMLKDGRATGAIAVARLTPGPFTDRQIELLKTFADQAVIAIENVRLFTELQASNRELTSALDTQTATSDILRVISQSQTNVQPVFDAIVASAVRLLGAYSGALTRLAGDQIELAALTSTDDAGDTALRARFPISLHSEGPHAQVIRDRTPLNIADAQTDPRVPEVTRANARVRGYRSQVVVPMLRHDEAVGAISVTRRDPGGFTDDEVALLKTFADQAVIAIENVRLFNELEGRNRDLTATSEILRVISSSPTDVQPAFDTIVRSAVRLCNGLFSGLLQFDGELIHHVAQHNFTPEALEEVHRILPARPSRALGAGRAILERAVVQIPDAEVDPEYQHQATSRAIGFRSGLWVPMLREGAPIGVIMVARAEPGPFSDSEIELLRTFADQAVIAVENVRLFKELEARNRDLMATGEILQVISRSPTDVQPVFDTIAAAATTLCAAENAGVFLFDGTLIHFAAHSHLTAEDLDVIRRTFPRPPGPGNVTARAILTRAVAHTADIAADPGYELRGFVDAGVHAILSVPMLRDGGPIGAISVARREAAPFTDNQIALLQTFADQAVIAIENVRLFKELQARTAELTQSVEQLTALGEVSRAVSSTLDVETVLDTIVSRATQLAGADGCAISEYDDATELFHVRATHGIDAALVDTLRTTPLRKGEGVGGRATEMREPIQIADIAVPGAYQSHLRDVLIGAGFRAVLSVPLLREEQVMGSLSLSRKAPGEFSPEVVEVLKTFATQSALAIQNARLFREIADKSAQLEAASRHKSEFLANMSHELRTPLNAIIGFSEVLVDRMFGELNEKQEEYLKDIYASGQHLLSLINDILDLSKIEAGRMELELADFDLPSAIDNALILVRERATRRGITLGRTIDEQLGMLRGDERKVKQVLLNLLSNALKFTPEGGRIDVSAGEHDEVAEVSVTDTGVGIAPEDQEAVFEEFRQVGTADKKVEGTGLGLALSRKFIELHGGKIWVKSQVGHGSTFTFTLPVHRGG